MNPPRYDCHVHLVGNGLKGNGCWVRLTTLWHRGLGEVMRRVIGVPVSASHPDFDELYLDKLLACVRTFHPARPDALDELDRCLALGARALKLLPNCQNVNCALPRYDKFWGKMAEAGLPFLAHTGGEMTVPVANVAYQNPRILERPLQIGVKVIAAHSAGNSNFFDKDYFEDLLKMFGEFPHLYADTSALNSPMRSSTLAKITKAGHDDRFLHGSDYPVPIGTWWVRLRGLISGADRREAAKINNLLERDAFLKKAAGFQEAHFTKLGSILRPI
ncbi:MAG: amidohydrolase family protein [Verrucomicrobia bacterium]|nr:amidohydrolase family protein [Verrucomicrobiota bacterium]